MPVATLEKPRELEEAEGAEMKGLMALLTPEGLIFMPLAILLDIAGLLLAIFVVSEVFSYISDFIGLVSIGFWTYFRASFRSQEAKAKITHGAAERLTKLAKTARRLRWLRPLLIILEFVPFVGAAPCWTLLVYFELQS